MSERDLAASMPDKLTFRVERTEYADIEIDVPGLVDEWGEDLEGYVTREWVKDTLWKIGVGELMWSGDFVRVLDKDTEEDIR